jgi:hypothetical protein
LFLRPRRDGAFAVTGMARGAFRLAGDGLHVIRRTGGKPERLPLENLRKAARE